MDFSDMLVRPDSLKELQDQLEHAEIRGHLPKNPR